MGLFANFKAMKDVQKIKNGGTAYFTISAITNLIINLPDAQKALDRTTFDRVFELYRKMDRCKTKMKLDFDGYLSSAADILKEFDKIAPCESYLGMEPFEAMMVMKEVRETYSESQIKQENLLMSDAVTAFHVARNLDGTIQPIVAASICPTNTTSIKLLLSTDNLGVDEVSHHNEDFYYFVFDKNASKPLPSVMILKFIQTTGGKVYIDMKQEDMKVVTYAIENYLS